MKYRIYASIQRPILVCFTCISGLFSEVLGYNLNLIVSYYFSLDQISVNDPCFTSFSVSWGKWLLQHQFFLVVLKLQWAGYKQPTFSHLVLGSRESA